MFLMTSLLFTFFTIFNILRFLYRKENVLSYLNNIHICINKSRKIIFFLKYMYARYRFVFDDHFLMLLVSFIKVVFFSQEYLDQNVVFQLDVYLLNLIVIKNNNLGR